MAQHLDPVHVDAAAIADAALEHYVVHEEHRDEQSVETAVQTVAGSSDSTRNAPAGPQVEPVVAVAPDDCVHAGEGHLARWAGKGRFSERAGEGRIRLRIGVTQHGERAGTRTIHHPDAFGRRTTQRILAGTSTKAIHSGEGDFEEIAGVDVTGVDAVNGGVHVPDADLLVPGQVPHRALVTDYGKVVLTKPGVDCKEGSFIDLASLQYVRE